MIQVIWNTEKLEKIQIREESGKDKKKRRKMKCQEMKTSPHSVSHGVVCSKVQCLHCLPYVYEREKEKDTKIGQKRQETIFLLPFRSNDA